MDSRLYQERMKRGGLFLLLLGLVMPAFAQTAQEWRDSLTVLNKAIERNPQSIDLRLRKAAVNIELEQWDYAIEEYGRVLQADTSNLTALFFRAYANSHLRRYGLAKNDYEAMVAVVPRHFEARLGLAMTNRMLGRQTETMDELNALVQLFPDSALAYAARAGYETELRQYDTALYDWDEALARDSSNVDFLVSKVDILIQTNRKKEARRLLMEAIRKDAPGGALQEWLRRCQ